MTRTTGQTKAVQESTRQRIARALLAERLGLEGDWRDPEFKISLPPRLPLNPGQKILPGDVREIESGIRRLETMGCHKRALYWCIAQLGKQAEDARQGWWFTTEVNEDESKNKEIAHLHALATREDMVGLITKVSATTDAIRNYRRELLLVAEACSDFIDLPGGWLTEPVLPEESLSVLLASLHWVQKLATAWESPNAKALIKSKGLLFLLAYVWHCTASKEVSIGRRNSHNAASRRSPYRLSTKVAQGLSEIVHAYQGSEYTASDLNDKLQDFADTEPTLFGGILALTRTLDETARRDSFQK
jgi:hypothetical protein